MAGLLNEALARHHVQERLRSAEEQRRRAGAGLELDDGRTVYVRQLRAEDRQLYSDAVAGLSPRSRYLRFAAPVPRISESLLDQMMDLDGDRQVAYAALVPDGSAIVGVARFVRMPGDPRAAEVAIAVADAWQGRGIGSLLLATVIERAGRSGLSCLKATTLSENRWATRLAISVGFSPAGSTGIYAEYRLPLPDAG
ncbi:MAG TPA: GNAT family N-acetyltransferase [Solirubrobacteraceae bacterium]|jgi:RimJ/RimL family protein N-acetyltransferase